MGTSKLKEIGRTTSTTMTTEIKKSKEPPSGAKIISEEITTSTEQIENGYLVCKNYNVKYEVKGETNWTYYSKKWFSKTDPLTITINDKSLSDAFDDSDE